MEPFDNDPSQQYYLNEYDPHGSYDPDDSYNSDAINFQILSIAGGMLATSLLIVSCRIICSTIKITYKDYKKRSKRNSLLKQRFIVSDENNLSDCPICLDSFHKNNAELEKFPNYINFFSFPFGQPESSFSKKQIDLIFNNGAKKIFRSFGTINNNPSISYLDRITLGNKDSDSKKVLFNLFKSQLRTLKRKYFQIS